MNKQDTHNNFNISEPMRKHYLLEVKGVKFTVSTKELRLFKDLLELFLKNK